MANYIPGIDETKKFLNDYIQPTIANILSISDEGKLAEKQAKDSSLSLGGQDTLRHLLLGAYTTSEGGFDIGKRIGGRLINFRELGEGDEGEIDINNNNLGKILAKFYMSKEGGELRGDALKEQILKDAKILAASVDTENSPFPDKSTEQIRNYLYGKDGLMNKLNNYSNQFKMNPGGFDVPHGFAIQDEKIRPMLSTTMKNKGGIITLEPFDPNKHKPIQTIGDMWSTEYLITDKSPEGKIWNIPSIWFHTKTKDSKFLDRETANLIAAMYEKNTKIKFPRFKTIKDAEKAAQKRSNSGGAKDNKLGKVINMDNQTVKAFAIGGEVTDPISGNEVPEGSFPNEVRDDVPAMLSEGEYVVPADVLRFYGLKFFEDLRENAKIEIARMSQEGRIGGDPIEEPQSLNDEDVVVLERMVRNANNGSKGDVIEMAKGGLIDKFANTIKMNPGGLVSSNLYSDPNKIDAIIKEVSTAAKDNPALFQRLASKGVVLDKTNATMKPEEMLKENKPKFNIETGEEIVTANEGGLIGYSNGGYEGDLFNPYFYQKPKEDNTIDERYANESGEVITKHYKIVDGIKMLTGYTRDSNPDRKFSIPPLEIPAGFNQLLTASESEMDNLTTTPVEDRDGPDDTSPPDTTAWSNDLNMNDPESVQDWINNNQKSKIPGIIGAATNITREYRGNVIGAVSTNDTVKNMMEDYNSQWGRKTGFVKDFITTPNKTQLDIYSKKQTIKDNEKTFKEDDKTVSDILTSDKFLKNRTSYSPPTPAPSSSEAEAPSSEIDTSGGGSSVDMGGPEIGDFTDNNNNDDYADQYSSPFNKGGLATKKSKKKAYNKGGYSTKKKMNTGGLVQKKKKKNSK